MMPAPAPSPPVRTALRVALQTLGCRSNKYDTAVIRGELMARGYEVVSTEQPHDVLILNSCTVTHDADRVARQRLRAARRRAPTCTLLLTGCYAELGGDALREAVGADLLVSNQEKPTLVDRLDHFFGFTPLPAPPGPMLPDPGEHTRFFFKIQDGCNVRCAFCIIPDARGSARSLPPEQVVGQVREAVARGFQEVILSGIHLGAYGRDLPGAPGLAGLLRRILTETDLPRLRLGSVEPWGVRPDLLALLREDPRFLPSLHLPLQSGCDRTLRAMKRPMGAQTYRQLIDRVLEACPNLTLWLDVIAGFPGETSQDFDQCVDFVEALPFARLHVFPYSPRRGTPAASLPAPVPPAIIRARVTRLLSLSAERWQQTLQARIGHDAHILVESGGRGHTRDNLPVQLVGTQLETLRGQIVPVALTELVGEQLRGALLV